jgi:hypothetical protein
MRENCLNSQLNLEMLEFLRVNIVASLGKYKFFFIGYECKSTNVSTLAQRHAVLSVCSLFLSSFLLFKNRLMRFYKNNHVVGVIYSTCIFLCPDLGRSLEYVNIWNDS